MARLTQSRSIDGAAASVASSSAGGPLTITKAAVSTAHHYLSMLSYGTATSTTQYVRVYDGTSSGALIFERLVLAAGAEEITFPNPLRGSIGAALTVRLTSATSGLVQLVALSYADE